MKKIGIFLLCFVFLLSACAEPQNQGKIFEYEDLDLRIVDSQNQFGFDLFKKLVVEEEGENIFISPASIAIALTMTLNGADEETKEAMSKVLYLDAFSDEEFNKANQVLKNLLENADPEVQLDIANSLWARKGKAFFEDFIERNKEFFDATLRELDFTDEAAADIINAWVEEQTNGKIDEIVEAPIHPHTILFLINAIYFNGGWTTPFEEEQTMEREFHLQDNSTMMHPFMNQSGDFFYYEGEEFSALKLPYGKDENLQAYFFLPEEGSSLLDFQNQMTISNWQKWQEGFQEREGSISIPKFELEYEKSLNDILSAMGMGIAFDEQLANFGRMTAIPPNVFIADVKHKTYVNVNEEGTEAAAVTKVEMRAESAVADYFQFVLDRPFYFSIVDEKTGSILFMGSIIDPS